MNWFYATKDKQQVGPVDEATLAELLRSGTISTETLVWKSGMEGWKPYATVFSAPVLAGTVSDRCSECGQTFPPDQLISLAGRSVCATCKPIAVQKYQEGVLSFGSPVDAEELWSKVQQRGFNFTIGSVFSRSWSLVRGNFGPCLGVTLLAYVILISAAFIPILGNLSGFFIQPQLMAGLSWYFLKQFRGESAVLNDSFAGFRRGYGQQALYVLIVCAAVLAVVVLAAVPSAFVIPMVAEAYDAGKDVGMMMVWISLLLIPLVLVMWYFMIRWTFASLLILDKGLKATAAMKLSARVVHLRFWKLLGLFLLVGLICSLSVLALVVGILFTLPFAYAVFTRVYEDAFGEEGPVTPTP